MTVALDIGASALRSLRIQDKRLQGRTCETIYSVVEDTPPRRQMLDQLHLEYAVCDGSLAIPGDSARDLAQLFHVPVMPLMPEGKLPEGDPPARQLLAALIEAVLPVPTVANELCGLTLSGESASETADDASTREFLIRLVQLRGYTPRLVHPGMAVVLAELVADGFTGIGLSFGAAACHACLANRGQVIATCVIPRGGNWIDEQIAIASGLYQWDNEGNRYLDVNTASRWKEASETSLSDVESGSRIETLTRAYAQLLDDVASAMGKALKSSLLTPEAWPAMTVVACGGPTRVPGFSEMLDQTIRRKEWPVRMKRLRIADDADFTIPRGSLIQVEVDAEGGDALDGMAA